jgi:hypothetical protein
VTIQRGNEIDQGRLKILPAHGRCSSTVKEMLDRIAGFMASPREYAVDEAVGRRSQVMQCATITFDSSHSWPPPWGENGRVEATSTSYEKSLSHQNR